ncbi:MAG TPA: TetR/AcrR family transcriptional regulator [Acidobacteriaceae bacterium]|nr:TetR/AcrR family transcriptional regulator [Acidobacteriaceae bacterium]
MKVETRERSLRERQKESTHGEIVDTAMEMILKTGDFSHEAIAGATGMAARTVYRHFPSREELIAATWDKLRARTGTRFPRTEEEILELAPEVYGNFDQNEKLVRAFLFSGVGSEVRDRGAREGRPAFRAALKDLVGGLPVRKQKQVVAVFLALYSAPAWQMMRDRGELSGEDAGQAVRWALSALLASLKKDSILSTKGNRNGKSGNSPDSTAGRR